MEGTSRASHAQVDMGDECSVTGAGRSPSRHESIPAPPGATVSVSTIQSSVGQGAVDTSASGSKQRTKPPEMVKGLDVLHMGDSKTIAGWIYSYKAPFGPAEQPCGTETELAGAYYLEYHPRVAWYQRGDTNADFNRLRCYATKWDTPFVIPYYFEDKAHEYWPDWVGEFTTGQPLIFEAGEELQKKEPERTKLAAARYFAQTHHGEFWLGFSSALKGAGLYNRARLHRWRDVTPRDANLVHAIRHCWHPGARRSIEQVCDQIGKEFEGRWRPEDIQAAAWKILADAVAGGHAIVEELDHAPLDLATVVTLTDPSDPIILPALSLPDRVDDRDTVQQEVSPSLWAPGFDRTVLDPTHQTVPGTTQVTDAPDGEYVAPPANTPNRTVQRADHSTLVDVYGRAIDPAALAGTVVDPSAAPNEQEDLFYQRLDMVRAIQAGASIRSVAESNDTHYEAVRRLLQRYQLYGEAALMPHALYNHKTRPRTTMRSEFADVAVKLCASTQRLSFRQIADQPGMDRLAKKLSRREGKDISKPHYHQVCQFLNHKIATDPKLRAARGGDRYPQEPRTSRGGFIARLDHNGAAGLLMGVDIHDIDALVTLPSGLVVPRKIWGAAMLEFTTGAVFSALVSLIL